MDKEYINKVVEDIFVEEMSKLEIKTEVFKRLDKELKGEDRAYIKILEYEIQQLEDDSNKNLQDCDEENLGCQSGDDDGRELDFG